MAEPRTTDLGSLRPRLERAFEFAARQVRATIERTPDYFPIYTVGGRWQHKGELWTDWCAGFHAGMMWRVALRTGDPWWRAAAEHYSKLIEPKKNDAEVHDLGFIFLNTYLPWYDDTGDDRLRQVLVAAGETLAKRFNPKGRYLRSFLAADSLFIDIMMNVPLIFYAARQGDESRLSEIAAAHCRTTERALLRPDGSTAHEGIFDLETGAFLRPSTQQGFAPDSTWSRGLAWSLYGFAQVYGYTSDPADLAAAERNADCFLRRLPEGYVPPWDFDAPEGPERPVDSSAAAIAACGLWELADHCRDQSRRQRYCDGSLAILDALCTDRYVAWDEAGWEGVLKHGVYHLHKGLGVDESVMWGDYFFLEAVDRALGDAGAGGGDGR